MTQCFKHHSAAAVGQGGYGLAESPGLFLAPRHAERAFACEYCFPRPRRLRPVWPWVWSLLVSVCPCTWMEGGVDCFAGTMRCLQQRLDPGTPWTHTAKPYPTLMLLLECLGPGAATANFESRVTAGHVNVNMGKERSPQCQDS